MVRSLRYRHPATDRPMPPVLAAPIRELDRSAGNRRSTILWGLFGFLMGAVFWHVVGFWDFVTNVVQKRDRPPTVFERALSSTLVGSEDGEIQAIAEQVLAEREHRAQTVAQTCTTLTLDRADGRTSAYPCMVIIRNVPGDADAASGTGLKATAARLDLAAQGR